MIDIIQTSLPEAKARDLLNWVAHPGYQVACEIAEHLIAFHQANAANAALDSEGEGIPLAFHDAIREAKHWLNFRAALSLLSTDEKLLRVLTLNPGIHRD